MHGTPKHGCLLALMRRCPSLEIRSLITARLLEKLAEIKRTIFCRTSNQRVIGTWASREFAEMMRQGYSFGIHLGSWARGPATAPNNLPAFPWRATLWFTEDVFTSCKTKSSPLPCKAVKSEVPCCKATASVFSPT